MARKKPADSTRHPIENGTVACPLRGRTDVETCVHCGALRSHDGTAIVCTPVRAPAAFDIALMTP
jgi:hypothetical protein